MSDKGLCIIERKLNKPCASLSSATFSSSAGSLLACLVSAHCPLALVGFPLSPSYLSERDTAKDMFKFMSLALPKTPQVKLLRIEDNIVSQSVQGWGGKDFFLETVNM